MTKQNTSRPARLMPLLVAFAGGRSGPWRIERIERVSGEPLQAAARLSVVEGAAAARAGDAAAWVLRGVTSNERYVTRREHDELAARQEPLGRPGSTRAALIPADFMPGNRFAPGRRRFVRARCRPLDSRPDAISHLEPIIPGSASRNGRLIPGTPQ